MNFFLLNGITLLAILFLSAIPTFWMIFWPKVEIILEANMFDLKMFASNVFMAFLLPLGRNRFYFVSIWQGGNIFDFISSSLFELSSSSFVSLIDIYEDHFGVFSSKTRISGVSKIFTRRSFVLIHGHLTSFNSRSSFAICKLYSVYSVMEISSSSVRSSLWLESLEIVPLLL